MCESEQVAGKWLEQNTTFMGKDNNGNPQQIPGKRDVAKLSNKQVYRLYPIVEKFYQDYRGKKAAAQAARSEESPY
jgi:hypothetical protein